MTRLRSQLAPLAPLCREPDEQNARQAAAAAWHKNGILMARPEWLHSWADQKQAELLAEKLWGKRNQD